MFKHQTSGRKLYAALGGPIGLIAIILIAIIITIVVIIYLRKKIKERKDDADDFLRFQKLIRNMLKTQLKSRNYDEERAKYDMNRFQFSSILLPVGDATINKTWDTDTEVFGDLCNSLIGMMSFGAESSSKLYKDELLWKQVMFAIKIISGKLPTKPRDYSVPWGTNWYQFSITYPTFLVATAFLYYDTFGYEDSLLTRHLSSYINNYFKESPIVDGIISMGWLRYESNVIGMSVPVIGGRLYSNRFDPEANSQKYARDYMAVDYVYTGNGFYYDNTYITHVSRNDGYTTSFYHEFKLIFDFYRMDTKFFKVLHKNFSITEHPDFPLHHGPWFSRTNSMKAFAPGRAFAVYGVDIRGFERGVCVRTKDVGLFYCGQILPLAAYESDRVNKDWGQCWIFMRRPIIKTTPDVLYKELVPYYDGVFSYGLTQIEWPSQTTTTTTFNPNSAWCSLCYLQDKAAGMYNKYQIEMGGQYMFDIEEFNLATPTGYHVYYKCTVDMVTASSDPYTLAIRLGNLEEKQANRLTGIGANFAYAFDDFMGIFLYLEEIDIQNSKNVIKLTKVMDPNTSKELDALYIQPSARPIMSFGYSNNFYQYDTEKRHNQLNSEPTLYKLTTDDFILERLDTEDAMIYLYNIKEKTASISYAFTNELPRSITIKKSILDNLFETYKVPDALFDSSKNQYTLNTYERQFQLLLTNVTLK